MTPIATAVEPLRHSAVQRAEEFAEQHAQRVYANLERNGWDMRLAYPYPNSGLGRASYMMAKAAYDIAHRLTKWTKPSIRPDEPCIVVKSEAGLAKFVQEAKDDADATYTAFIAKLEQKVGEHQRATLTGNHVWGYSILTVETAHETQRWKTQQIINVSKLGKVFNQWPTRKVK
jgi:hypothetical protein